jgi:hypothetical protein
MANDEYSLLVCGATFAGLGAAQAAREAGRSVLVIERTASAGKEFVNAFNPGRHWAKPLELSPFAERFRDDLVRRNVMEPGGPVHLPAMHPILCLLIKESGLDVRFLTEVVDVKERGGRYCVRLINAGGLHEVIVDEILDTSSDRATTPGSLHVPEGKRLNAYLYGGAVDAAGGAGGASGLDVASLAAPEGGAVAVVGGRYPSEVILKFAVAPTDDWPQGRRKLHLYWKERPAAWQAWTIAAIADEFESLVAPGARQVGKRWSWLPSEGFDHPLEAIDQGVRYVRLEQLEQREGSRNAAMA